MASKETAMMKAVRPLVVVSALQIDDRKSDRQSTINSRMVSTMSIIARTNSICCLILYLALRDF